MFLSKKWKSPSSASEDLSVKNSIVDSDYESSKKRTKKLAKKTPLEQKDVDRIVVQPKKSSYMCLQVRIP